MTYTCRMTKTRHLADGELQVLKALWKVGSGPVRAVQTEVERSGRELAYNTVQTVLSRLVEKELVACDKSSVAHTFRPLVTRDRFRKDRVRELLSKVFDGAFGNLALQLVQQGKLSADEIDGLQAALDDLKKPQRVGKSRKR